MSRMITATQDDPNKPGPEDWRPVAATNVADKERAEFLSSWGSDDPSGGKGKAARAAADPDDDDDLDDRDDDDIEEDDDDDDDDDDEEDAVTASPTRKKAAAANDDDEEEEEDEEDDDEGEEEEVDDDSDLDEDDKPNADPVVAKGMQKLQRQEQRMRQQFERDRAQSQAELARERESVQAERTTAAEAKAKYDRIVARAKTDPVGALEELGVDDWDYTAKMAFTRSKEGSDPANKAAAARLQAERELKGKIADVEKKLADREKTEAETAKEAKLRGEVETYLGGVVKSAATVKAATLTQRMLKDDPAYALERIKAAAGRLYDGKFPSERAVIVEVEKAERAMLRRYGINPRTLAASAPAEEKATTGRSAKSAKGKAVRSNRDDDLTMPSREKLLKEDWTR